MSPGKPVWSLDALKGATSPDVGKSETSRNGEELYYTLDKPNTDVTWQRNVSEVDIHLETYLVCDHTSKYVIKWSLNDKGGDDAIPHVDWNGAGKPNDAQMAALHQRFPNYDIK
jgi:hypothetical protein